MCPQKAHDSDSGLGVLMLLGGCGGVKDLEFKAGALSSGLMFSDFWCWERWGFKFFVEICSKESRELADQNC